ncbi:hypothetical protein GC101_22220 [Paenibacillus sp. LMG 31459]|uniref:Ribbon-helix-helix protein CopG domain-containing protein n=1 Tax=Paenibacillus phytohabitans TaxID=2654978 RepID=A0ABX1YL46_9BACL|nr:hypothetical protein [Paenibacillus phytohabitans]NOU81581.1 hypothetical protein [Paenibacillus phytohabitans]
MAAKKMGRPPSVNPKSEQLSVKMDKTTETILDNYCLKHNVKRPAAVREAISRLNEEETRYFWSPEWRQLLEENETTLLKGTEDLQQTLSLLLSLIRSMKTKTGSEDE